MRRIVLAVWILIICTVRILAADGIIKDANLQTGERYAVRLINGELLIGTFVITVSDEKEGEGIKLKTEIGTATIYESQIAEIIPYDEQYRHAHRVFLLPTGEPIKRNAFIGNLELFALFGGVGITDYVSITAGRTMLPSVPSGDQISFVNVKATVYNEPELFNPGGMSIAAGVNMGWLNAPNQLLHAYVSTTFTRVRSRITGLVMMNLSGNSMELFTAKAGTLGSILVRNPNGVVGVGIGVDSRFPYRQDLHFIGELWNNDISKASSSVLMLGLRIANTSVSADFGFAVFSRPYIIPVMSFAWTPM
ncbi:MAG: hypothetical protein JNJ85_15450 [Candidatus Kapabacteria bacterium]|nr:hypothetical protein [Candidatus Kapabacteria bacterium]